MTTRNFRVNNGLTVGDITINASTNTITGISTGTPSADGDVVVKGYLDTRLSGISANAIATGDSSVTVTDSGTGSVVVAIDGGTLATFAAAGLTLASGEFVGTATAAQYSDLAERFASDYMYEPGTVVALGGAAEITAVAEEASDEVFGVVSGTHQAAFKMNGGAGSDATHPYVAMTGRVDVKVIGSVNKGDRLISASVPGYARAATKAEWTAFNVIGRALTSKESEGAGSVLAAVRTSH
jgi:hypothetical protein